MASSVRISQLASVNAATDDDVFVINDADTNTRKITYASLTQNLVSTSGDQVINGNLNLNGTLSVDALLIDSPLLTIDTAANAIGVLTDTPQTTLDVHGDIRASNASEVQFGDYDNSHHVSLKSPNVLANTNEYTFPGAYPAEDGYVLASEIDGEMSWIKALTNPMTTIGDMVYNNTFNQTDRLPIGTDGQVLTVRADGIPGWLEPVPGFADPMQSPGDMIYRNGSNSTVRFPIGTPGQGLIVGASGVPIWNDIEIAAAGNTTEIQWNNAGVLSASPAFTFNNSASEVTAWNLITRDSFTSDGPAAFNDYVEVNSLLDARSSVSLGTNQSDTLSIQSLIDTSLLPVGGQNIGAVNNRWGDLWMGNSLNLTDGSTNGLLEYETVDGFSFYGQGTGADSARITIFSEESTRGVTIRSPLESAYSAGSYTLTLPTSQSPVGIPSILANDGTGQLSWGDADSLGFDLQAVTDAGDVTTNSIAVGGLAVQGQVFPGPGLADQILTTDGAGFLSWTYVDADFY